MRPRALFLLLVIVVAGLLIWRPDWRAEVVRRGGPMIRTAGAYAADRFNHALHRKKPTSAAAEAPPAPQPEASSTPEPEVTQASETPDTTEEPSPSAPAEESTADSSQSVQEQEQPEEPPLSTGNLPLKLPNLAAAPPLPAALRALRSKAQAQPSAFAWRRLADAAASAGFYAVAAEAYQKEAAFYRQLGDPDAAQVETLKAGRHATEGSLYLHARPESSAAPLAKLEPAHGCLIGAFIDRDESLPGKFMDENWQTHRDPLDFETATRKRHASYFCYLQFGRPFPFRWAERLRQQGIVPHLAVEPRSLAEVTTEAVSRFVKGVGRFNAPVFIRFAGEMNGVWTRYHGDPSLYREKFRLFHDLLARRAPKAALIWCVNTVPEKNIPDYYPGDDAVDWVGVNMYSVFFEDNRRDRPADYVHPADLLKNVYRLYSPKKPIAICEYAASHQAAIDPTPRPEWAALKIAQLYRALPRLYPRVKLVDWFDCNNLKHARADRQLNNYSVTDDPTVLAAYRAAVAPASFIGRLGEEPAEQVRPLRADETVTGVITYSACVRAPMRAAKTYLLADDRVLFAGDQPGVPVARWDTRSASPGTHVLRLLILDPKDRVLLDLRKPVMVNAG